MEGNDIFSSTTDSIQKYIHIPYHKKNITSEFGRRRLQFTKKRHLSQPSDSTSTLIDNKEVSNSLNTYMLKLSLNSIYEYDPRETLKQIFSMKGGIQPKLSPNERIKQSISSNKRRCYKMDSIFQEKEADLIREELNNIKSPRIWHQVVQNFKHAPSVLLDLIPLE